MANEHVSQFYQIFITLMELAHAFVIHEHNIIITSHVLI